MYNCVLAVLSNDKFLPFEITSNLCNFDISIKTLFDFSNIKNKKYFEQKHFKQIISISYDVNVTYKLKDILDNLVKDKIIDFFVYDNFSLPAKISGYVGFDKYYAIDKINGYKSMKFHTSKNVKVGIIDSGIYPHKDLINNLSTGWDFVSDCINTSDDTINHGTVIAGIIAASGNEVHGICKNVSIVPLKVSNNMGFFEMSAVIKAINYAIVNNIPILNYCNSSDFFDATLEIAIGNYKGLFVCSAGNNSKNLDEHKRFPPSLHLENIISVAATDINDSLLKYSNFGKKTVHLTAPGQNIYTTSSLSKNKHVKAYSLSSGTSVATPFVTATAVLIKNLHKDATTSFIKNAILESVDKIPELEDKVITGGRLNIYKALQI